MLKNNTKVHKVVIIGHGFTSRLCVIRSVAQLGCDITVIVITGKNKNGTLNTKKPIDCYSKYVNRVLFCEYNASSLIRLLLSECVDSNQKVVLFPDSDFAVVAIDSNQGLLNDYFLFPYVKKERGTIVDWMNKEKQKKLAYSIGLNVVKSKNIEIKNKHYLIPSGIDYPCFTKTKTFLLSNKQTLKRCDNEIELREFVKDLGIRFDLTLIVEDYKEIETEYAVVGFSDGTQVVIPGVVKILTMAHGNHFGVACKGEVMPIYGFEELISKFKNYILEVGYVGIFDIDFYNSGGDFYFGEMNLRIGGSCCALTKMGVNLPGMMVKSICGEKVNDMPQEIKDSAIFVNERMCLDDWYFRYISTSNYFEMVRSADISFIKDDKDPAPYKAYISEFKKRRIKRVLKKILLRNKVH